MTKRIIAEIGGGDGTNLKSVKFFNDAFHEIYIFEPSPILFPYLLKATASAKNVFCYNLACFSVSGVTDFICEGNVSCIDGIISPFRTSFIQNSEMVNVDNLIRRTSVFSKVQTCVVESIIGRKIYTLYLDCEGSELYVLKTLKDLPSVISISLFCRSSFTSLNHGVRGWLFENKYQLAYKNETDCFFEKS